MTVRKPATFRNEYSTLSAEVFKEGEIVILAETTNLGSCPELSPCEARALAHWLTLAAEYAESLELPAPAGPDPREMIPVAAAVAEHTADLTTALDRALGRQALSFPTIDQVAEMADAQLGLTGALK